MEEKKMKKRTAPPRYDDAFKAGAVRLVTEQGRQPVEVAKELGICIDTLRSWLKASGVQMGQVSKQNREQKRIRELEAENRSLRRQLGEKDEVIDVLKKNPSASCRNRRGEIPLRPDAQASGGLCGTGMPGFGGIPQRVLRLEGRENLQAQAAKPDNPAPVDRTAREVSGPGAGQPVPAAEAGIWLLPQTGTPADAPGRDLLGTQKGL